jgi:hypothetical protein
LLEHPGGLPQGYDTLYHAYRTAELGRQWEAGVYFPRWADSFYYGYGYPVFHYYASSTYALASAYRWLMGGEALGALRFLIAFSVLLAGGGMYLAGRQFWGREAGLTAALVYVYSPYLLQTNPYVRGALPELLACALFPWILWRFSVLCDPPPHRRAWAFSLIGASGLLGLLILTHNLMALAMAAFLGGYLLWQRAPGRVWLAYALGMGLAAAFWLPVLAERGAVQLDQLVGVAELDYRRFFVPTGDLLGWEAFSDAGALNGPFPHYQIGFPAWIGLLGFLLALWHREKGAPLFFGLAGLALLFLMTPQAALVWEALPPLAYLQFPSRLLGLAALCAAMLGGYAASRLRAGVILLWLGLAITAGPLLYMPHWQLETLATDLAAYHASEVAGVQRGTTFTGEFLPHGVKISPGPNPRLLADFADGPPVDKLHREVLPPGVEAELLAYSPQAYRWRVNSPAPFELEILTFYWPGWRARINGEPVPIQVSDPHGWMRVQIPAGQSEFSLRLESTPPRNWGYFLSGLSALSLGLMAWRWPLVPPPAKPAEPTNSKLSLGLIFLGGGVFALTLLLGPELAESRNSRPGEARPAQVQTDYHFGEGIRLLGYDLSDSSPGRGEGLRLALYWYADSPPAYAYASFVHLSAGDTPPLSQSDRANPGGLPTVLWTPEGYVYDLHYLPLPPDLGPGTYELRVGLWTCEGLPVGQDCGNGLRLGVTGGGEFLGDRLLLATITVK